MRKVIVITLLAAFLAGCEDFPVEGGGGDDFAGVTRHQVRATRAHGGMDDNLLRVAGGH